MKGVDLGVLFASLLICGLTLWIFLVSVKHLWAPI